MNQYVNHTASDDVQSDIRAISALQAQSDDLSSRILEVEADVSFLKDKELIARENVRTLLKNNIDYERRLTYLEKELHVTTKALNDTEKVMGEFKLFMGYTPSKDH